MADGGREKDWVESSVTTSREGGVSQNLKSGVSENLTVLDACGWGEI